MSSIDSIFEAMPVEEGSTQAPSEPIKEMGDRVRKGDTNSRIESFGEMLGDDDYESKPKPHEPIKVEKDKTPVAAAKDREESEVENKEDVKEEEVLIDPVQKINQEIPKDTKVKVKIDGQDVEVTLQELKNDYAGKQSISKRFTELDREKKSFQKDKEQVLADGNQMKQEIADLKGGFESTLAEFNKNGFVSKNPLGLVDQLLDRLGINSYAFNKAVFEHNLPEYARYFEMDEVQQDAYFAKRENEYLRKKDQTFADRTKQAQADQARQREEFNLIKQSGLSVDDFNSHFEELADLGSDDLSVGKVLEFARVKPIFDKAGDIVSKTVKAGDVALIQDVSRLLMEFPNTTEDEIIEHINGKQTAKAVSKKLSGKENYSVDTSGIAKKGTDDEYTDDEMEMIRSIRRR